MLTQCLKHLLSFCSKCFASEKVKEKAHECKCSVHTMLLVAKLHLEPHGIKSKLSSLSVPSFCSLHVLRCLQGPIIAFIDAKVDFYLHALINTHLLYGWACQSYWVKCWVISEFSNKTRKTSCINKSMKHGRLNEQPAAAGWTGRLIAYAVPQWPVDTGMLAMLYIAYLFHTRSRLRAHTIKHLVAAAWSVCSTSVYY